ncbi:transglycosylase domain-containing protein [Sphingobacterium sp. E70]|uniref:transglycosylase domain-containing protein n=1 Tax=Sphingobacterium sp. E70 TaxID=2853439 RepID=UPI00359C35F4
MTAVRLERNYTKDEIVTMYFNTVDFGAYNTFGIKSAARTYFNTTPDKLTADQAALLVGMLKGPGAYSPVRFPEKSKTRRNTVLNNMVAANFISAEEASNAKEKPLGLELKIANYGEGLGPYFRAVLKDQIKKEFANLKIVRADGTPYDLDRDGLKIYTTINMSMQQYAEDAQKEWMKQLQSKFSAQWKNRDPFKGDKAKLLISGMKRSDRYRILREEGLNDDEIKKPLM